MDLSHQRQRAILLSIEERTRKSVPARLSRLGKCRCKSFRMTRGVYVPCWTGTERTEVLFDRATGDACAHKVLLPGAGLLGEVCAKLPEAELSPAVGYL